MVDKPLRRLPIRRLWMGAVAAVVLLGAALLGSRASPRWLILLAAGGGAIVLLQWPVLRPLALVVVALLVKMDIGTGTEVALNPAALLVPVLLALWLLDMMRRREWYLVPSRTNMPLFLFLLAGLLSLLVGNVLWDPAVPRSSSFILVQLAQWAIFCFSAGAFWLVGNLVCDQVWLRRLTLLFLAVAGMLAILLVFRLPRALVGRLATPAMFQAPFWALLAALAGGQLLFNRELGTGWRWFSLAVLGAEAVYAFVLHRKSVSYMVGVVAVVGTLAWLRWPRLRWPVVVLLLVLFSTGFLFSAVYDFAGGEAEWERSGGSRLALIGRVIKVTMRNPITGLGPAAYRRYAGMEPLAYGRALWIDPKVNSHNNYVDLFSQFGLLGLGLFLWFAAELTGLGFRLRTRFTDGFAAGYVNAILAAWAGSLALMLFADWIVPFVYNVGFPGFQASVLVWLFLGGLVSLDNMGRQQSPEETSSAT